MHLIHAIFEPRGDGPHPTILALHGRGANALDLLGLAPYLGGGASLTQRKPVCERPVSGDDFIRALGR